MKSLRSREDRRLFGISHWLVRVALSHYDRRSPAAWRFSTNDFGKPLIDPATGPSPLTFSLAHTKGLAAVAVTRGRAVGVDVERTDRTVAAQRMISRFFAPEEARALNHLPSEALTERFFLHWTLKEAGLKALGTGFSLSLTALAFRLSEDRPRRIALSSTDQPGTERLRWAAMTPRSPYLVSLGVFGDPDKTVLFDCIRIAPSGEAVPLACTPLAISPGFLYDETLKKT